MLKPPAVNLAEHLLNLRCGLPPRKQIEEALVVRLAQRSLNGPSHDLLHVPHLRRSRQRSHCGSRKLGGDSSRTFRPAHLHRRHRVLGCQEAADCGPPLPIPTEPADPRGKSAQGRGRCGLATFAPREPAGSRAAWASGTRCNYRSEGTGACVCGARQRDRAATAAVAIHGCAGRGSRASSARMWASTAATLEPAATSAGSALRGSWQSHRLQSASREGIATVSSTTASVSARRSCAAAGMAAQ